MRGLIKQYINQLKDNKTLKRTTIAYMIIGCALLVLFGIITTGGMLSVATSRISSNKQQMLLQSCNTGDLIFRDVNSLVTKNIDAGSVLYDALYERPAENASKINSEISKMVASSSLIKSVYIINLKYDIVYSSDKSECSVDEFFDQDIIDIIEKSEHGSTVYYPRVFNYPLAKNGAVPQNYISCIYNNSSSGAVVINLNQQKFQSAVNLANSSDTTQITAVVDSSGNVISHSEASKFASNVSNEKYFPDILAQRDSFGSLRHFGMLVNYARSSYLEFYYVSIANTSVISEQFLWLPVLIAAFILFSVLLYLAAGMYITTASFKTDRRTENYPQADENDAITAAPPSSSSDQFSSRIKYNFLSTKRNELVHKLLVGTFTYSQDELDECGIIFDNRLFGVVMARIDRLKEIDPANVPLIKYGIMNIGDEVLAKTGRVYSIESNEYDIAWVINYNDDKLLIPAVEQIQKLVESIYKITASFGCNFGADSIEDISDLYHNAQYSLSYRLSMGYNSIILYNSIKDSAQTICEYPEELENSIIDDIKSGSKDAMKNDVHRFMETISSAPYSTVITHSNRLLTAVDALAATAAAEDDEVTVNNIETMTRMETIAEIESFVAARCESVSIRLCKSKIDSKKDIISNTIINYIDEHFRDSNLSIDMIANEVNKSANYTRSIFKQSQGISISEYISNKRFDEVCRLLRETDISAQEIGRQIGLNSGSYFYTAFKKHTGYTPDQYRKIHRSKQQPDDENNGGENDDKS